jgi:general secretion pathway protein D
MRLKDINTRRGIWLILLTALFPILVNGGSCDDKLFTVTIDSKLTIGDAIENLADTCDLTVTLKDEWAKKRLDNKLYFVKLKNTTLEGFLDTILKENDLGYTLRDSKLSISYLTTRTFRVHYISGTRTGVSSANVTIANSSDGANTGGNSNDSKTGIEITSNDEFKFWKTVESEVQRILIGAADGSTHYTKNSDTQWTGPNGKEWEYNPLAPIVNPDAGMITVTGTSRQLSRVGRYIETLKDQIRKQVLIDVRIITVTFSNSSTTGVDWSQLYSLQNVSINTYAMGQKNVSTFTSDETGIMASEFALGAEPKQAGVITAEGSMAIQDVVKFLSTQGDVKAVSSPRVMTLNNQPALISVGQELFYKIKSSSTAGGSGGAVAAEGETVDSVFAGVLLDITPEINSNGMITLKINPSITDTLEPVTAGAGTRTIPPDLIRRQIASVIKIKDGNHAILGGLITTQRGTKINKVPLLGDIPLLSNLFRKEEKIEEVVELILIITPHIVHNGNDVSLKELGYRKINGK